jgi:hypothetical protein
MHVERKWINQPSKDQPYHNLHGTRVLATAETATVARIYFLEGAVISQQISWLALSDGWPRERDTLEALCVEMLEAMEMADKYVDGEGSRDELDDFNAVLTRARSILT